jgi:FlaA1/EpsC-like NDP-sugar epimerase
MCERIIIFGTGARARMAWEELSSRFEVVSFADNDVKKHGTVFLGRRVIKPAEIMQHPFDKVVVASIYAREILPQLEEIGIERQRIQCY